MDPMKKEKKESAFYSKYMAILDEIEDDQFHHESVRDAMRRRYKKARMDNNPASGSESTYMVADRFVVQVHAMLLRAQGLQGHKHATD
jgi:hypothetical protein